MILSDADILDRLAGDLVVEPSTTSTSRSSPRASTCGSASASWSSSARTFPVSTQPRPTRSATTSRETRVPEGEEFILHPGDFVLGTTHGARRDPPDLLATVQGRSSLGRLAIVIHATAGIVDPGGTRGRSRSNCRTSAPAPVALTPGMRVSQLIFTELKSPAKRPYGVERGSKYQDQDGPQASRIGSDPEFHSDENRQAAERVVRFIRRSSSTSSSRRCARCWRRTPASAASPSTRSPRAAASLAVRGLEVRPRRRGPPRPDRRR